MQLLSLVVLPGLCVAGSNSLSIGAAYVGESAVSVSGAATGQGRYFGLGSAGVTYTHPAGAGTFDWHGSAWWLHGNNYSNVLGDLNGISNIAGVAAARLNHLSVEYASARARVRAGRFDIDDDFMAFASSDALLNGSFGGPATATANFPLPTFPLAALGALLEFSVTERLVFTGGIFDGDVGVEANDLIGFELGSSEVDGVLIIGQWSLQSDAANATRWLVGGAAHTGDFLVLDSNARLSPNGLIYGGVERSLGQWQGRDVTANVRVSAPTAGRRNPVTLQIDTGIAIEGLLQSISNRLSLGALYARSANAAPPGQRAPDDEWVFEINYRLQPFAAAFVQPALQYVNNRDLAGGNDALILMVRFGVEY